MICLGFAYCFIIAGILRAVFYKWQLFAGREITVFAILAGIYLCVRVGKWCIRKNKNTEKRSLCKVIIESAGVQTMVTALIDTGNSLTEPVSKRPVCLMEEELLARITLENPLFLRAIPFRSVGCEQGLLYGVQIPKLIITCDEDTYVAMDVICAGVGHRLSSGHAYQMILHPALVTKDNGKKEGNSLSKRSWRERNVIGKRSKKNFIYARRKGLVRGRTGNGHTLYWRHGSTSSAFRQ